MFIALTADVGHLILSPHYHILFPYNVCCKQLVRNISTTQFYMNSLFQPSLQMKIVTITMISDKNKSRMFSLRNFPIPQRVLLCYLPNLYRRVKYKWIFLRQYIIRCI